MRRALRQHARDVVAITVLVLLALAITGVILARQTQPYPSWIPFLGDDQFELRIELPSAQAVTPGQGQTVNIAGVQVGDITGVELEDGRAVVTVGIDEEFEDLIHADATALLRPRTGLQDMTVELDPGDSGEPVEEGFEVPLAQTEPNVQVDEILASLDRDTRAYLQLLLQGGGDGLGGRGRQLSAGLRRLEPLARDLARINAGLARRRQNIRRAITSFRQLAAALARSDTRLAGFVSAQDRVFGSFADQEASLRETLRELPPTLRETRRALAGADRLALELGPASEALIPAAQAFAPGQRAARGLARRTLAPIRDQIRPFTRRARPPLRHLEQAAAPLGRTVGATADTFADLEQLFNAWAYNPPGREEGYLFWTAWLNHNSNNIATLQDAHGPLPRAIVLQSCLTARRAEELAVARPFIWTLQRLTNAPRSEVICPLTPPVG